MKLNQNYCQSRQKEGGGKVETCRGEGSKRTGGHGEEREGEKLQEQKKDQEEAARLAIRNDMPSKGNTAENKPSKGNTTEFTSPATNLGIEGEHAAEQLTDPWEAGVFPERKKSKQSTPAVTPVIKSGRYALARISTPTSSPLHNYVHKRVILDGVLDLNKDDPITSFTNCLCVLINNAKMVDEHFAICSVKEGGSVMWWLAGDIPTT